MSWYSARPFRTLRMRFSIRTPVWTRSTSYLSTMVLIYHGTQFVDQRIFGSPEVLDPVSKRVARRAGVRDRRGHKLLRHVEDPRTHDDSLHAIRQEVPHRHVARVRDRDIDDRVELFAEGGEDEGGTADAGAEEIAIRRGLFGMLRRGEARPLEEVQDRHRDSSVAAARTPRSLEISAAFLGMTLEIFGAVPAHERKIHDPAGLADYRKPDQAVLEKKAD